MGQHRLADHVADRQPVLHVPLGAVLDAAQLDPATMVLREPTLDDVFLELTGHTTVDDDGEEGEDR